MAPSPGLWCVRLCVLLGLAGQTFDECLRGHSTPACEWSDCLPASLNRHQRRALLRARREPPDEWVAWNPLAGFGGGKPSIKLRRRSRYLAPRQRRSWTKRLRHPWGLRGTRVGEASNPGPPRDPDVGRPAQRRRLAGDGTVRVYCPVESCGAHDPARSSGWDSHQSMRNHLDDHCSGILSGSVPQNCLDQHDLQHCRICGLLVRGFHKGCHPRCRPTNREAAARPAGAGGPDSSLPGLDEILAAGAATVRHVPKVARAAWAQCLARPRPRGAGASDGWMVSALPFERSCLRLPLGARTEDLLLMLRGMLAAGASAADGDLSRASTALLENTLAALETKHPQASPPDIAGMEEARPAAVPEFSAEAVARRGQLQGLQASVRTTPVKPCRLPTPMRSLLARGEAPSAWPRTCMLCPNRIGGVRPIAVGESSGA